MTSNSDGRTPQSRRDSGAYQANRNSPKRGKGHYKRAPELGWNPFFVKFNLAMAKCLERDFESARTILNDLTAEADSYMSISKYALLALCEILEHERADQKVKQLRQRISERGFLVFDYANHRSDTWKLVSKQLTGTTSKTLAPVFRTLRVPSEQPDGSEGGLSEPQ
jgi:hypothetical protein